jgi:hypothetical protein
MPVIPVSDICTVRHAVCKKPWARPRDLKDASLCNTHSDCRYALRLSGKPLRLQETHPKVSPTCAALLLSLADVIISVAERSLRILLRNMRGTTVVADVRKSGSQSRARPAIRHCLHSQRVCASGNRRPCLQGSVSDVMGAVYQAGQAFGVPLF